MSAICLTHLCKNQPFSKKKIAKWLIFVVWLNDLSAGFSKLFDELVSQLLNELLASARGISRKGAGTQLRNNNLTKPVAHKAADAVFFH
ncbi:MAG: hypothetical protein J5523_06525 [Muribaculaceae bacterium]|nr:hypothetical protein [Muribaculaceae bacterium]